LKVYNRNRKETTFLSHKLKDDLLCEITYEKINRQLVCVPNFCDWLPFLSVFFSTYLCHIHQAIKISISCITIYSIQRKNLLLIFCI